MSIPIFLVGNWAAQILTLPRRAPATERKNPDSCALRSGHAGFACPIVMGKTGPGSEETRHVPPSHTADADHLAYAVQDGCPDPVFGAVLSILQGQARNPADHQPPHGALDIAQGLADRWPDPRPDRPHRSLGRG